jgi:hypothetical protein
MTALLRTISAYQAGLDDFNKTSPEDDHAAAAYAEVSYGPHLDRLNRWDQPAESIAEATEALRISISDNGGVYGCEAADRMVKSALAYIESRFAITPETSLYCLLAMYWERYEVQHRAMQKTDRTEFDTPERAAAEAEQFASGDHLDEVTYAILSFVPRARYDAMMKASFVRLLAEGNGGRLEAEETDALISSLPDLVYYKDREDRA